MNLHDILSLRGGKIAWKDTIAVWWAFSWRTFALSLLFGFVAGFLGFTKMEWYQHFGNTLVSLVAYLLVLRWVLNQQVIVYKPGNGYFAVRSTI